MPGRCDADVMLACRFTIGPIPSGVAGRQHDLDFEADRIGIRCDDCAAVLTYCLESNRKPKARPVLCPWIATWFPYTEERLENLLQ